jgi:membrane-associated protein
MTDAILTFIESSPGWVVILVPALAFAESCVGIGLFVSGVLLLSTSVILYGQQLLGISTLGLTAFAGALAGDLVGYAVGRWFRYRTGPSLKSQRFEHAIHRARLMFQTSAVLAVFAGRFIPAIRSITPMIAGATGLAPRTYLILAPIACLLWSFALCFLVTGLDYSFGLF